MFNKLRETEALSGFGLTVWSSGMLESSRFRQLGPKARLLICEPAIECGLHPVQDGFEYTTSRPGRDK